MIKPITFITGAAVALSLVSCSDDNDIKNNDIVDQQEAALKLVVEDYVNNTVVPTYRGLADATVRLAEVCDKMCESGVENLSEDLIRQAGNEWIEARRYWELSEAWLYGAASDYDIDPHIDTWPLDKTAMDAMLNNEAQMS